MKSRTERTIGTGIYKGIHYIETNGMYSIKGCHVAPAFNSFCALIAWIDYCGNPR